MRCSALRGPIPSCYLMPPLHHLLGTSSFLLKQDSSSLPASLRPCPTTNYLQLFLLHLFPPTTPLICNVQIIFGIILAISASQLSPPLLPASHLAASAALLTPGWSFTQQDVWSSCGNQIAFFLCPKPLDGFPMSLE